jgi:RimJ/RimL family protein N-acetyltransferase
MPALPLQTPSLLLRRFEPGDASAIMALNGEPSTAHSLPSHVYEDLAIAQSAVAYLMRCYVEPGHPRLGPYVLAVEARASSVLLGHVGFSPLGDEVEVSYAIAESARGRGRGLGAEALAHACAWGELNFQLSRVIAVTSAENLASQRLLGKTKFVLQRTESMRFQGKEQEVRRYAAQLAAHGVA